MLVVAFFSGWVQVGGDRWVLRSQVKEEEVKEEEEEDSSIETEQVGRSSH